MSLRPPVVPDHTLLRPIGRGAYGEVWLARNVMGMARAVKVVWRQQFTSERPYEREFAGIKRYEPVSRSSGGLVHVLHVGRNDEEGYFYYVMELADAASVQGPESRFQNQPITANPTLGLGPWALDSYAPRTLRSDLRQLGRLPTAECLRLAIDVASGLGQLHRRGLVHRDVKPGNIIYVNGRAKLADIGLVSAEGEGRTFVGTEGYVPPEGPGLHAADLYALGISLYEASTGLPPERFPDVPTEWFTNSDSDGEQSLELHEIVLKACEGQRQHRYANAEALQAELALLQSGESVRHTRALRRRYRRLRISGAVGASLLVLALGTALFAHYRARLAAQSRELEALLRRQAQQAQARAEQAETEAHRQLQSALYEEARALVLTKEPGHRAKALEAIKQAAGSIKAPDLRRVAFAALGLPDLRLEREMALPGQLNFVQMDPRLERLALGDGSRPVTVRSVNGSLLASLPATGEHEAFGALWSPDGRFLAVKRGMNEGESRSEWEVWNVAQPRLLLPPIQSISFEAICFHPRSPSLMLGHSSGAVSVLDLESLKESQPFRLASEPVCLTYSPDGQRVAASYRIGGGKWVVAFHEAASGALLGTIECPEPMYLIAWHPGGQWVGVAGREADEWNRGVWLLSAEGGPPALLGRHKIKTTNLSFNPDGRYLMSCGWDREMFCWDLQTRDRAFTFPSAGYDLAWGPDGSQCAMVPKATLRYEQYAFDRPLGLELSGNRGESLGPGSFSPDGRFLVITEGQNICLWDLKCASSPARLPAGDGSIRSFFSPDSSVLFVVCGALHQARLSAWRLARGSVTALEREQRGILKPQGGRSAPGSDAPRLTPLFLPVPPHLNCAALAGDELVLSSEEGVRFVSLSNLSSSPFALDGGGGGPEGRVVKIPSGQGTVSPDGRWLAVTYSYSPQVGVYRLPKVEEAARLVTSNLVARVYFSPAGDELLVINRGGIEQWDTGTWQLTRRESGSPVADSFIFYSPDGTGLWRVTNFRDTAFCARRSLEPILPLPVNLVPLALSADGRQLAVSLDNQRVQIWDLVALRGHLRELGLDWENP